MDTERLQDVVFEADYWKGVLADVMKLNALIHEAAGKLTPIPLHLLPAAIGASADEVQRGYVAASGASAEAMNLLEQTSEPMLGIIALANGRLQALSGIVDEAAT